jgi:hypothetical protein
MKIRKIIIFEKKTGFYKLIKIFTFLNVFDFHFTAQESKTIEPLLKK